MRFRLLVVAALIAGGCNVALNPAATPRRTPGPDASANPAPIDPASGSAVPVTSAGPTPSATPSATPAPGATASPTATPVPTPTPTDPPIADDQIPDGALYGVVLDAGGNPVQNVPVTAYRDGANPLLEDPVAAQAVTGTDGLFQLFPDAIGTFSIEAVASQTSKARKTTILVASTASAIPAGALRLAAPGTLSGRVTAPAAPTVDLSGLDVFIPGSKNSARTGAGGAYSFSGLAASAYDLAVGKAGLGQARVRDVLVAPGQLTTAGDLELAVRSPLIASVGPDNGGDGVDVTISGDYFGAAAGEPFDVKLNGVAIANPTRINDQIIRFKVPPGVGAGNVVVTVAGIPSAGKRFAVLKTFNLNPGDVDLLVGKTVVQTLTALDTGGQTVQSPNVTWSLIGTAATLSGFTATQRSVTAGAPGDSSLKIASGNVSRTFTVHAYRITQVTLSSSSIEINGLPADGSQPEAGYVTSATLTASVVASDRPDRKVVWSSLDPQLVSVSNGVVVSKPTSSGGTAAIKAAAEDDPTVFATASVEVTTYGQLDVVVH